MSRKRTASSSSDLTSKRVLTDKSIVTVAIDFGTAGTGYGYSFLGSDVIEAKEPGGQEARKTLTNLLLARDGSFKSFGFEARREYAESQQGVFFQNYKMALQPGSNGFDQVKALDGSSWSLLEVVSKTLRYVKDEALRECGRSMPNGMDPKDVQWVLTVPAIWADGAKGFMRKAAFQAGMTESLESPKLVLALEPESAAIACDVHQKANPGESFMVLDTGGGTVDITMNTLKSASPLRFDEIAAPSGGPWGSTYVDKQFENFVEALIGRQNFVTYKASPFWIDMQEAWEKVKIATDSSDTPRAINMASVLEVLVNEMKLNDLVDTYNRVHNTALKMRGRSTVVFPAEIVRGFFKPVLDSICTHVARLVAAHPVKYIFLVGGFAESQILQEAIKARFSSANRHVIVPVRPGLAVLRGAVQFGQNQDVFSTRVARFTYGIRCSEEYDPTNPVHARGTKTTKTRMGQPVQYVDDVFRSCVKVGTKLPAGHQAETGGWSTVDDSQVSVTFTLYTTPLGHVDFYTDPSCKKIGSVAVPCHRSEKINVTIEFGATEIVVSATNQTTGEKRAAKVTYNH